MIMKKKTPRQLKKRLDEVFSIWIRMRGAEDFNNQCYTCGKTYPVKQLQNGHFVSRVHTATRWHPINCQVQCYACNVLRRGNLSFFAEHLMKDFGPDIIEQLNTLSRSLVKMKRDDYERLIEEYS